MNNLNITHKGTAVLPEISPLAVKARLVFTWLAWIFAASIIVQIFLAGLALFHNPTHWAGHTIFPRFFLILPVLMLAASFIARLPLSLRLYCIGLIALIILIAVSANLMAGMGYVSALHPVLALLLFWATVSIARKAAGSSKGNTRK